MSEEKINTTSKGSTNLKESNNPKFFLKAPLNVFAQPHFRTKPNTTRMPFKGIQENAINKSSSQQIGASSDSTIPSFAKFFSVKSIVSKTNPEEIIVENNEERDTKTSTLNEEPQNVGSQITELISRTSPADVQESEFSAPNTDREEKTLQDDDVQSNSLTLNPQSDAVPPPAEDGQIVVTSNNLLDPLNVDDKSRPQHGNCTSAVGSPNECLSVSKKTGIAKDERDDDELYMVIDAVHRWKNGVERRDSLIKKLKDNLNTLNETVEHQNNSLNTYRERIFILESLIKHQQDNTERNREKIEGIKTKYLSYRDTFSSIRKYMEEIREGKNKIENEIDSLRLEFNILVTKHQSASENHISNSQSQQAQIAQATELNTKLIDANTQLSNVITQLRQVIQDSENKATQYALESETARTKLENLAKEKEAQVEECEKLKTSLECADEKCRTLTLLQKENEEKLMNLMKNYQEVEQNLKSLITEKDKRISQLSKTEEKYEHLQLEHNQEKTNSRKELDSLQKELDAIRTQQMFERQRSEYELRDLRHQLQTEFYRERCQLENEWRNERSQLESDSREERVQRLRLESELRDERSERFRFETDLHNSNKKLSEITLLHDNEKSKISQLESKLNELENRRLDRTTVAVGTSDIPDLDLQLKYIKTIMDFEQENRDNKKKFEELDVTLEAWRSKAASLELQLDSLTTKHGDLQNEHNKVVKDMRTDNLRHNEIVDKLNPKVIELTEEIETLRSEILRLEANEKSILQKLHSQRGYKPYNNPLPGDMSEVNSDQVVMLSEATLNSKSSREEHVSPNINFTRLEESKGDDQLHLLTLTEIDSMILDQVSSNNPIITQEQDLSINDLSLVKGSDNHQSQEPSNDQLKVDKHQAAESALEKVKPSEVETRPRDDSNSEHLNDWLSPSNQARSKRRKMNKTDNPNNSQYTLRSSVPPNNTTQNTINTRNRFKGKLKSRY
ncbi:14599_t:CDS:10 [Acaulospora morrowiae]|uniref:14599_t:CDS:1 n=1 Tax=Acaulospora morrowiae TaxID=94023 RepID=A0A9N9FVN3_9GLOM|nr:14599_t:CDS:10 [Acaulospora morrowiae]